MNWKKIGIYLLLSFAISWAVAGVLKIFDMELGTVSATILIAGIYMPGPALATFIIQKFIYKEGFKEYGWNYDRSAIKWILRTPLFFIGLLLLTFAAIGLLGNTHLIENFGQLDFSNEGFNARLMAIVMEKTGGTEVNLPKLPATILFFVFIIQGVIAGITVNLPFMFGEEFGWRGLLLRETQAMGFLPSSLFIGVIWGLWHLPIVLMGHNYPHNPHFGAIMMCLFTTALCPIFAYVRIKTKSILGACMMHGMINATGALFMLYVANGNELYSSIAGWAGVIAGAIATLLIFIFDKEFVRSFRENG